MERTKSKRFRLSGKNRKKMNSYFEEYCENTSIHGLKYLGERRRSCLEKLWWFLTISVCIGLCTFLIFKTYYKWNRSPVIVSFATKQIPIFEIPFPAVTICPEAKTNTSIFSYSEVLADWQNRKINWTRNSDLAYMSLVCLPPTNVSTISYFLDDSPLEYISKVVPNFNDMFDSCEYETDIVNCSSLFKPVFTDEGVCYSFNMMDREDVFEYNVKSFGNFFKFNKTVDYSSENKYGGGLEAYPRRARLTGAKMGLKVNLKTAESDKDPHCGDSLQGYKIILHHPAEVPRTSHQYFRLPLNQAVVAAITPNMMTTTEALKGVPPEKRQCHYQHEKNLTFFKVYNQENCELECLANFMKNNCNCTAFYMPRLPGTKICGPEKLHCTRITEKTLMLKEIRSSLEQRIQDENVTLPKFLLEYYKLLKSNQATTISKDRCNCLPACSAIKYDSETSQSELYTEHETHPSNASTENNDIMHYSMLVLYFKDYQFIPSERSELYGLIDFLASCGGLLGLFVGFSFISLVEIIYFLTLRWCCNIVLFGRKFWSGANNKSHN